MQFSFWLAQEFLPPGLGFGLYGFAHKAWLAILTGLIFSICFAYKGMGVPGRRITRLGFAFLLPCAELGRNLVLAAQGVFRPFYWPLQLCGLAMFLFLGYALRPNRFCGEVLYSLCLPGAVSALVFPDWAANLPAFQFQSVYSFLYHGILVGCIFMLLASGELRPGPGGIVYPVLFLALSVPVLFCINRQLGTNFFFLQWPPPGSPLELLARRFGTPGFLLPYALLTLFVVCLFYLPVWVCAAYKKWQQAEKSVCGL